MGAITKHGAVAGALAALVFAILLVLSICHQMTLPPVETPKPTVSGLYITTLGIYAAWTVLVPLYLFVELLVERKRRPGEEDAAYDRRLGDLKLLQDAARPVWAGCAAAIGIMLI